MPTSVPTPVEKPELTTATDAGAAAFTVTPAVCVMATAPAPASAVAESVFPCATVELKVVVNTPLPLEAPEVGLSVLPEPLDAGTTVAPLMTFVNASRTVTVIVEANPTPHDVEHAVIDDVPAVSNDCDELTPA